MSGLTSRCLPLPTFTNVNDKTPRLRPVAMLKVSGVATSVRNAGNASLKSSQCRHRHESRQPRQQFAAHGRLVFFQVKNTLKQEHALPFS